VNVHHQSQPQLPLKQLFVDWPLSQCHHDQSSLNVYRLFHPNHVTSSLNDGSHMEPCKNEEQLFNVLLLHTNMLNQEMSSFNMNQFKFVLYVNSNVLVLLQLIQWLTFNNMVLNFSTLAPSFTMLVMLVLLKIFHHHSQLMATVQQPMVKILL